VVPHGCRYPFLWSRFGTRGADHSLARLQVGLSDRRGVAFMVGAFGAQGADAPERLSESLAVGLVGQRRSMGKKGGKAESLFTLAITEQAVV